MKDGRLEDPDLALLVSRWVLGDLWDLFSLKNDHDMKDMLLVIDKSSDSLHMLTIRWHFVELNKEQQNKLIEKTTLSGSLKKTANQQQGLISIFTMSQEK